MSCDLPLGVVHATRKGELALLTDDSEYPYFVNIGEL